MDPERILVVDDEPGVRAALEAILRDEGYAVVAAASGEEGLEAFETGAFDAVLLDVWLPGIDGLETLVRLRERRHDAEVVMISGHGNIETAVRATKVGAFDFVEKPLSLERTLLVLRNALRQRRLEQRNRRLLEQLVLDTEVLGVSPAAAQLRADVAAAAASEAPVLVCGERGTGRETVARGIHSGGRRAGEAFVHVPCAALDRDAAGEALFGAAGSAGRLALADRGTLFLESVERLDPALQARLAPRVDGRIAGAPDVRWLASTGPDPLEVEPSLRERLDVVRIRIPALRDRREDVPLLAERFMRGLAREYGRREKRFAPRCLAALTSWDWPGNVRELRNLIERLLLLAPGEVVEAADLPEDLGGSGMPAEDLYREFASLAQGLEAFERHAVRRALVDSEGDSAAAAKRLGIGIEELERRKGRLGLSRPQ
ncbi:MAG: sigma-54 dependent transcriptional regulator [Acidobacteriia bacterium]|nr:sigma-54 dependent transcriptional regulator [Terriglobia bacterium]